MRASEPSGLPRLACVAACLLSLPAVPTLLAQPTVTLKVQTDRPYVNEALLIELRVANYEQCEQPQFPELTNCTVRYVGRTSGSKITQLGRGRPEVRQHATFSYTLIPRTAGELTIPPVPVVVDGKTLKTRPYRLTVRDIPQSGDTGELLLAEITCAQRKLFVGQRANFALTVWVKRAEFNRDPLDLSEMLRFLTGSFGPFDTQNVQTRAVQRGVADGSTHLYYVIELSADFILDQPGPLTFETVSVAIDYPVRYTRSFFNDIRVRDGQRVRVRPTVAVPDVQPLPTEGRPANFSGAVGQFTLSTFAVPTNVRVGDPIKLVIDISGDLVKTLAGPDLTSIPELVENFRVPSETLAGAVSGNRKRFTQIIRAKRADVKAIPPIEFAYFDPQAQEYVVARSEPIPILVSAVEQLDAADLTDITADTPRERNDAVEARDGLRGIKTGESDLLAAVRPVTMTQVALTTVIPPLAFLCIWGFATLSRSRQGHAVRRRRGAWRNAERRIHTAVARNLPPREFHGEIEAALAGYLADRLDEPPARFLGRAAVTFLEQRGVDEKLVARCAELLERCERAAYAGGTDGDTSLADLARQCVKQLEREQL